MYQYYYNYDRYSSKDGYESSAVSFLLPNSKLKIQKIQFLTALSCEARHGGYDFYLIQDIDYYEDNMYLQENRWGTKNIQRSYAIKSNSN